MTTQSISALKMLKDLAAKEVELATEALAHAMKFAEDAQSKQDLLYDYRQGYVENLNQSMKVGISADAYQNYQSFFGKLDQAIAGQLDVVESAKKLVILKRQQWQESQRKKLSYEVLLQRSDKKERKVEQKKDQKMMDEFAMRISRTGR